MLAICRKLKPNFEIQNPLNQQKTNLMAQIHKNIKSFFLKNTFLVISML